MDPMAIRLLGAPDPKTDPGMICGAEMMPAAAFLIQERRFNPFGRPSFPAAERFVGDEEADRHLDYAHRPPWTI